MASDGMDRKVALGEGTQETEIANKQPKPKVVISGLMGWKAADDGRSSRKIVTLGHDEPFRCEPEQLEFWPHKAIFNKEDASDFPRYFQWSDFQPCPRCRDISNLRRDDHEDFRSRIVTIRCNWCSPKWQEGSGEKRPSVGEHRAETAMGVKAIS